MTVRIPEEFYEASVALDAIDRHRDLQVRVLQPFGTLHVRQDIADDYRTLYEEGKDLGRLSIVEEVDGEGEPTGRMLLADGHHRYEALKMLGREFAPCKVYKGDRFTAILLAARENGGRGLQFSLTDRKKVAEQLLTGLARRNVTWSDREIADWAGLDRATVSKVRDELKNRRGLAIPDDIEVHTSDGRVYTIKPAAPRPRWDPNQGYQHDELLDELPGANEYIPPPPPRKPARGSWHRPRPASSPDYPDVHKQLSPETEDGRGSKPWTPSKDFGRIEHPTGSWVASTGEWQPVRRVARTISYELTYRRAGEQGMEQAVASEQTMRLLPRDVLAQLLHDAGVMDVLEQLPQELRDKLLRDLRL
jgi:hypothetical protein